MLSRVTISPEENRGSRLEEIEHAWGAFAAAIPAHPLVGVRTVFEARYPDAIHSVARAIPDSATQEIEEGLIVIGEKFFDAERTADERHLTLLHESIHLKFMANYVAGRTFRVDDTLRQQNRSIVDDGEWMRSQLSAQFLKFPDEIWAELYLRNMYRDWFDRRMAYYLAMREQRGRVPLPTLPAALVGYWQAYEWLAVHLGRQLDDDHERAARWTELLDFWESKIRETWEKNHADEQLARLAASLPSNFADVALNEGAFDRFHAEIMQVDVGPEQPTTAQAGSTLGPGGA